LNQPKTERKKLPPEELRRLGELYNQRHEFKVGDLVTFKPGMSDSKFPNEGEPAVVVETRPGRRVEGRQFTQMFDIPADIRIGLADYSGDFLCYWMDGNRFQPYVDTAPNATPADTEQIAE
jgi:hypothetical protein